MRRHACNGSKQYYPRPMRKFKNQLLTLPFYTYSMLQITHRPNIGITHLTGQLFRVVQRSLLSQPLSKHTHTARNFVQVAALFNFNIHTPLSAMSYHYLHNCSSLPLFFYSYTRWHCRPRKFGRVHGRSQLHADCIIPSASRAYISKIWGKRKLL